jgi:hypothetical protein
MYRLPAPSLSLSLSSSKSSSLVRAHGGGGHVVLEHFARVALSSSLARAWGRGVWRGAYSSSLLGLPTPLLLLRVRTGEYGVARTRAVCSGCPHASPLCSASQAGSRVPSQAGANNTLCCLGTIVVPMPAAQDHKRAFDNVHRRASFAVEASRACTNVSKQTSH